MVRYFLSRLPSSRSLIWPRISPPANVVVCTFAYTAPLRSARTASVSSPAAIPWLAGADDVRRVDHALDGALRSRANGLVARHG